MEMEHGRSKAYRRAVSRAQPPETGEAGSLRHRCGRGHSPGAPGAQQALHSSGCQWIGQLRVAEEEYRSDKPLRGRNGHVIGSPEWEAARLRNKKSFHNRKIFVYFLVALMLIGLVTAFALTEEPADMSASDLPSSSIFRFTDTKELGWIKVQGSGMGETLSCDKRSEFSSKATCRSKHGELLVDIPGGGRGCHPPRVYRDGRYVSMMKVNVVDSDSISTALVPRGGYRGKNMFGGDLVISSLRCL